MKALDFDTLLDRQVKTNSGTTGSGCLILFSLPFVLAGLGVMAFGLWPVYKNYQSKSWVQVPATLVSSELYSSRDSDGDVTYSVKGEYRYVWQGENYTGTKIDFYNGNDSQHSFHAERARSLERYRVGEKPHPAYVNPDAPTEAVLFRDIRTWHSMFLCVFGLVFSSVGFGLLYIGKVGKKAENFRATQLKRYPNQPWMYRKQWESRSVLCDSKSGFYTLLVITIFVTGLSSFVPMAIFEEMTKHKPNWIIFAFLIFNILAVYMIYLTTVAWLRWRRFGRSELRLETLPYYLGEELRGTLLVSSHLGKSYPKLDVELQCIKSTTTGSGKSRHTRHEVIAEAKNGIQVSGGFLGPRSLQVPIKIDIPSNGVSTSDGGNPSYSWVLKFQADIPGVDYSAQFDVPVYARDFSSEVAFSTESNEMELS